MAYGVSRQVAADGFKLLGTVYTSTDTIETKGTVASLISTMEVDTGESTVTLQNKVLSCHYHRDNQLDIDIDYDFTTRKLQIFIHLGTDDTQQLADDFLRQFVGWVSAT